MLIAGRGLVAFLTSRSVVVISTTCAVLYAAIWLVGLLQTNGLISTALPFPVGDAVVIRRSGATLRPAAPNANEKAQRDSALASAQTGPSVNPAAAASESPITLDIQTAPPVELWVFQDADHVAGTNPATGLVRLTIPGAAYSGRGTNPQLVSIPHASGTYHIQASGRGNGRFELRVRAFLGDDVSNATEFAGSGEVFQDTLLQSDASVSLDSNGAPKLDVTRLQVVLAGAAPLKGSASPSASPSPSTEPALAAGANPSPEAVVDAASVANDGAGSNQGGTNLAPAVPATGLTVARPRPVARLPLPLPLPELPLAPAVHQD